MRVRERRTRTRTRKIELTSDCCLIIIITMGKEGLCTTCGGVLELCRAIKAKRVILHMVALMMMCPCAE
jgi:hypothetical protein